MHGYKYIGFSQGEAKPGSAYVSIAQKQGAIV